MNELSNHDHSRFLTRTNHIVGRVAQLGSKAAEEGINLGSDAGGSGSSDDLGEEHRTVYYGDEAGVCGLPIRTAAGPIHGDRKTENL